MNDKRLGMGFLGLTVRIFGLVIMVSSAIFSLTACGSSLTPVAPTQTASADMAQSGHMEEHGMMEHDSSESMPQDMEHMHEDTPGDYADLTNPLAGDSAAVTAGQAIFDTNCASCHGPKGQGDGPASAALNPKPANLADPQMMDSMSDGYIFWRVSEGGMIAPFNSAMPAWKATLSEEQRWQVISYLRSLSR